MSRACFALIGGLIAFFTTFAGESLAAAKRDYRAAMRAFVQAIGDG
jgi:hypothetical protein